MAQWMSKLRAASCMLSLAMLCNVTASRTAAQDSDEDWDAILLEPASTGGNDGQDGNDGNDGNDTKRSKSPRYVRHRGKRGGANKPINPRTWHGPRPDDFALHAGHAVPPLVVHVVGQPEPFVITAQSAQGTFDEAAQAVARDAFGGWEGGPSLHARLLELVYLATRHFNAPSIHLISGLRNDRKASRHSHGMAADIVLPGVRDADLAAFFRAQGFTGVGTYPRSGFVHIDVRETSYFWVDRSPPNKRWKVSQVRGTESKAVDQEALARGAQPTLNPEGLQRALEVRAVKRRPKKKRRTKTRASKSEPSPSRAETSPGQTEASPSQAPSEAAASPIKAAPIQSAPSK